ncbi:FAD/NAD(P)-binding domain-containing protein [Melanomma pulvis-pyrius CBS 109.77]|uniref:FAD/NAD(P)-binding domain-containing protein n=1 Tax=Melanomma pulvis-pyrius CBS 109.77 TaxID=1314802 RepID=A0A6A6WVZ5_9PLEO|nr:FAD/NAD(P)-binding domain-containing protein [Melanomma pulvis-pyrius CBS 109.77]
MTQQPISIIGAGIGGLTLARCLLKHGIPSVLYERMPTAPRHNYGITLHASSYRPLLKVLELDEPTVKRQIAVDGSTGELNPKAMIMKEGIGATSFRANREKLESLLKEGLDVRWEHALEKIEEAPSGSGMLLCLQSGQRIESRCVMGADGPHSTTRKSLAPETALHVLPFVALSGKRRVQRVLFDAVYAAGMQKSNVVEMKTGVAVLKVAVDDKSEDLVSLSWVYSRPARGPDDPLHKPNRPKEAATDIPEEFLQEIAVLRDLEQPFAEVFDVEALRKDRVLHWLMRRALMGLHDLQMLGRKGVFFLGDSVHAEPILGGEGANVAIKDGVELAECILRNGVEGIGKWYDQRYKAWLTGLERSEKSIIKMHDKQR